LSSEDFFRLMIIIGCLVVGVMYTIIRNDVLSGKTLISPEQENRFGFWLEKIASK